MHKRREGGAGTPGFHSRDGSTEGSKEQRSGREYGKLSLAGTKEAEVEMMGAGLDQNTYVFGIFYLNRRKRTGPFLAVFITGGFSHFSPSLQLMTNG